MRFVRPLVVFPLIRDGVDHGMVTLADLNMLHASEFLALPEALATKVRVDAGVCGWTIEPGTLVMLPPGPDGAWRHYWDPVWRAAP